MKGSLSIAVYAAAGATLFASTYVGIAVVSDAPLHEVPGISIFVEPPETSDAEATPQEQELASDSPAEATPEPEKSGSELLEANVGLLGAYMIESPFSGTELRELVNELKAQMRAQTIERERLEVRALELDEWEQSLRERQAELADLRTKLEDMEGSIDLRLAELERDEEAREQQELQGWRDMARLYEGGTAEVNARLLAEEEPDDAALILRELEQEQAGEILRLITPASRRKEYMDAYRRAEPVPDRN